MPDGLYDRDFLLWSEAQANLLRRLAAGERVNAAVDWPNLIEEVESMGRSQLSACTSLLRQALTHLLKLKAWPDSRSAGHWRAEIVAFLADAERQYSPSMAQHIDLETVYRKALTAVRLETDESGEPQSLPSINPYTLEQLLADNVSSLWAERRS